MRTEIANFCSEVKQYFATPGQYSAQMARDPHKTLAENVRRLVDASGDSQAVIAKRGGISQRNVGNVYNYGLTHDTSPTLRTVAGLAKAFEVPVWMLFLPDMPLEGALGRQLATLVETFGQLPAEPRQNVLRVADAERRFATLPADTGERRKAS